MSILAVLKVIGLTTILTPVFNFTQPAEQLVKLDVVYPTQTYVNILHQVSMVGTPTEPFRPAVSVHTYDLGPVYPPIMAFDTTPASTSTYEANDTHVLSDGESQRASIPIAPTARVLFL
jgi:hypothetical protein